MQRRRILLASAAISALPVSAALLAQQQPESIDAPSVASEVPHVQPSPRAADRDFDYSEFTAQDVPEGLRLTLPTSTAVVEVPEARIETLDERKQDIAKIRAALTKFADAPAIDALAAELELPGCDRAGGASFGLERMDDGLDEYISLFACEGGVFYEVSEANTTVALKGGGSRSLGPSAINGKVGGHPAVFRTLRAPSGRRKMLVSWVTDRNAVSVAVTWPERRSAREIYTVVRELLLIDRERVLYGS